VVEKRWCDVLGGEAMLFQGDLSPFYLQQVEQVKSISRENSLDPLQFSVSTPRIISKKIFDPAAHNAVRSQAGIAIFYPFMDLNPPTQRYDKRTDPAHDPIRDSTHSVHEDCDIPSPGAKNAHP
jgi:hypothetical protein